MMSRRMSALVAFLLGMAVALVPAKAIVAATSVIGNFEGRTRDGWIDWNFPNQPTTTVGAPTYDFNGIGATLGTGAAQYNLPGGYHQWLAIKLQLDGNDPLSNGIADYRPGFLQNSKLAFVLTFVASEQTPGNDYANLGVFVNSNTWGFTHIGDPNNSNAPESVTEFTGYNGDHSWNPGALVDTQTSTWVYDIGFLHDGNAENGEIVTGNYVELIFEAYSNNSTVLHLDNVRFFTPVVLTADFNGSTGVNGVDLEILESHFGATGQTDNTNGDADANTLVDGGDVIVWQQQNGSSMGGSSATIGTIPEPSTALLAGMILGAAAWRRRR